MGLWKDAFDKSLAAVSVKSESLVESSRVRTAIANTQKSVDAAVTALGVKYYNSWLAGSIDQAEIEADCEKIKQLNDECANLKARLEQIKVEERQILGQQKRPTVGPVRGRVRGVQFFVPTAASAWRAAPVSVTSAAPR